MIGIIDYGMGNLFSVSKALERLEVAYFISDDPEQLMKADGLILPGVGAIKDAMELLDRTGLSTTLKKYADTGKPLLGICLGMQLLFEESEEGGGTNGLGLLPGCVKRFPGVTKEGEIYKVPHMGWNKLLFKKESAILEEVEEDFVYFVHSYYAVTNAEEVVHAYSRYEVEVPAVVGHNNVYGTQFHPEKSSNAGMGILQNFTKIAAERVGVS
ncbi:imidazole glycerol phosphate synthase subunit HisH [Cytobacillus horneckiae]|uniref:Imidazole glycerol phosphate synthase subunit HisH n=1 Tax=Cytobacillus horneckiae TaxID=549687 RepID=A0A2N0ZDX2_9BACI|nr:imidazole glycerol phosphate synthase subunit HisH [Cytobacillus horneckiae]MCM3178924.1 imidazole glycerol phosphate synthase subunit HisH [Cytobacillus horneckiae]MEC1154140.1 imidazole glycerol phosphate synthase subunit HisH [Cytobacillus horneckiae]MED2936315.1 imidazole glycerol phosphate synthase subunit HisH [Cytobacillus horneckiae]PKG27693.1 imidazole glycerol phosphate synthase subunit HisH [Cytobacillus horneckiae]